METSTLAPATTQFTLEEVVQHGQQSGRPPEEIAGAVKKWRDAARSWGEQNLREQDPKKWFTGNQKLDARIREEMSTIQAISATEKIASEIRDEAGRVEFARLYRESGGNPEAFEEDSPARRLAEILNREVFQSPAFELPDAKDRVRPLTTQAGVILGDFETQARPEGEGLDLLIRLDHEKEGSLRKAITIPEVTAADVESARRTAEEEAAQLRERETQSRKAAEQSADETRHRSLYRWSEDSFNAGTAEVGELNRQAETARMQAAQAESRAHSLADPDRGRLVLLRERVEEQVKTDKDLKKAVGEVALGEDFWRGVQQTHLGARMAIADARGNEEEKTKLRSLIGELGQIYPGSTNLQFNGGAGAFVSDVSAVMGGMLPTMMVSSVTGGMGLATNTAIGGLTRGAAIAPISLSAYGNAYATMLNEADSLDQQGRADEAKQRRADARTYAMLQAAVETGAEFIFKEEMFQLGSKGFLRKVGNGAAQNTAEEFIAAVGNAELDREFRDQLTPASQIARESALGTVVGGLMQVPGGTVEVFLPKPAPMESAPPGLDDPPPSDPGEPPPSTPPPTEEGTPPPAEENAPPPLPDPETPPPGEAATYKMGGRSFTWSEGVWTEAGTGNPVDPETEPGLVFQLGEAKRLLNAGEQPVSQEVTLTPGETPAILTIDGERAFLPAPDGKGWLEVFPQTGAEPRPADFATEGESGIAILRRLQAKMAEKRSEAEPPATPPPPESAPPSREEEPPAVETAPAPSTLPAELETETPPLDIDPRAPVVRLPAKPVALDEVVARPDLMQFKRADDTATGENANDRIEGEWRDDMAGVLLIWEPLNPAEYAMAPGEKYIVANGHHRYALAQRSGVRAINAQVYREADGISANDAMIFAAEVNIADGKGTIYDQVRFIRNTSAVRGETAALAQARSIGSRGRKAATIALEASDQLHEAFVNERVSPDHAAAISDAAPRNTDAQRVGLRSALEGKSPQFAANMARAAMLMAGQPSYKEVDLFGEDDSAFREMERMAHDAGRVQTALQERITASQSAAKRADVAREMGVEVNDPAAVQEMNTRLKSELERWRNWPMHSDLTKALRAGSIDLESVIRGAMSGPVEEAPAAPSTAPEAEGQLLPETEMPFNLASETITEAEPVEPEDTRTDEEKDADSGQSRLFDDRIEPLRSPEAEVQQLLDGFTARHPEKRRAAAPARGEAEERHLHLVRSEVDQYFGGDVPSGLRTVWDPTAVWDASYDRDAGTIELNAARLRPGEVAFKIEHEIGHVLFQDSEFVAAFEALWNALPKIQRNRISRRVGKSVEKGYYAEGDSFEETRVRALEAIRRMAAGDHADAAVKQAWRRFVAALARVWKRLTGRDPVNPEQLAAAMIQIGVAKMRSRGKGNGGSIYSASESAERAATVDAVISGAQRSRIKRLMRRIDAMYATGKTQGVEDLEAELEIILDRAESDLEGMDETGDDDAIRAQGVSDMAEFDSASPSPEESLVTQWYRWTGRGVRDESGDLQREYKTFGAFARASTGDNAYVIQPGVTDAQIEEAARESATQYERRRAAMRAPKRRIFSLPEPVAIDFEAFKNWALSIVGGKGFIQEDSGRLWVASDPDGKISEVFGSFADADAYFRDAAVKGEFLWDVTESYERMVGGIPLRRPDGPITSAEAASRFYPVDPAPGETPAEVGNLPRLSPTGRIVTSELLPDLGLRYGLSDFEKSQNQGARTKDGISFRKLPDPNKQHRKGARVFSLSDNIEREQSAAAQSLANLESDFRASFFAGDFDGSAAAMEAADLDTFEAFALKLVRLASAGNLDAGEMLDWVKQINAGTKPESSIDPELESLLSAMRSSFPGRRRGRTMADLREQYYSPDAFERAFAQHVVDGDFQKAYEAVRDSDDGIRIPTLKKWLKAARKGDAVAQKNLEWLSAIFNGTLPPGVTQQPSSGGPSTKGSTTQPPPRQQAPPPPPPPPPAPAAPTSPPPRPQGVEKLNLPALVFLARKMGTTPLVRRFQARGSFRPSNKRGEHQDDPVIKVNEFLGKEDWQQAARTLAHEIGHFIDYIINAVPNADIVKRLVPLKAIREQFIEDIFGQGTKYSEARKYMMEEAVAISTVMRGAFSPSDPYRNASVELYADFMSAVMIDPDLAFDTAPLLSHAWFAHLDQKPSAEAAWNLVQDLLKGDALHEAIRSDRGAAQRAAMSAVRDRADHRSLLHAGWKKVRNGFSGAIWSRYLPAAAKGATTTGRWEFTARWWTAVTTPKQHDFLARMEGAEIEASQRGSALRVKMQRDVYDPLLHHGIDTAQLDEYLTFFQILHEDTATRQYLEENPDEFREFLLWLDDAAGLDRSSEIGGASNSDLDQIGASMVGTIQLHEKFETIYAMAQSSDAPDIAASGLFAFDIARYQWNQEGHTPETAQQGMSFLRRELGDERFEVLRDAAQGFHGNLAGIVREANQVGLFSERIWSEKIAPNIGNYVPRMVLDYFTGEMSASIKQRRGSVKATLPKYLAGEGQAMVLLHKIAKQKQMLFILEQSQAAGWADEIQPFSMPRGKDSGALAKKLFRDERKGLRGYFVKGKWQWLTFDDADVVRWMDTASPDDLKFLYDLAKANEGFWRLSVTVLNASFALYNNWVRMVATLPMDYGPKAVAHALRQIPEAVNWAKASLGLADPSDRVLDLVERGVLPAFGQYTAGDLLLSHDDLIDQISSGLVGIDALRRGTRVFGPFEKVTNLPGIHQAIQFLGLFTGISEALPKLAVESLLDKRGLPQWERDRLARMEGIPNTGLSAGKYGTYAGLVSLFYRVWVQGTRRLATLPFNPRTRGMWWTGNLLGLGLIKAFYAAAAAGIIDALMGGDDDEEKQVDWQEAYTRLSPYKIRMTDALFLGWALPDGSFEAPWGHSAIPADWKPMMWRLPFTESGRLTAPLATLWTWNLWESPLNLRSSKDAGRLARDVFFNSVAPSPNPVFENLGYATSLLDPKSPYDPYSGRDVVPKDQWDAGISSRAWGITKHLLEETPAKNFAPAMKNGIRNEADLPPWARALMSLPGSSAAISFDNHQLAADYADRLEERDTVNRAARLLRGPKATNAVSMRSRLNRIPAEKRTGAEQEKIDILNEWYRKAYLGSDLYPGLFRELQAAAAGMEGIEVEETKRMLEETAVEVLRAAGEMGR